MKWSAWFVAGVVGALSLTGCGALYPELSTQFSEAPNTQAFDPPPPADRHFVKILRGKVPSKTRDGRDWDQVFGSLPDPIAKVIVNDQELFATSAQSNTLEPTWPDAPAGNFLLTAGDKVEVQLWDSNTLSSTPIGVYAQTITPDHLDVGEVTFPLSGGGEVVLAIQPAKAIWGCGFWYELRNDAASVTRLVASSPASRLGIQAGDDILSIDGKTVDKMSLNEVRSTLGSIPSAGRMLSLRHRDGGTIQVTLKEGPIYPLFADYPQLPVLPK